PELDEEIRMLGERYGIPTEFTSYLVMEPQLSRNAVLRGGMGGAVPAMSPAAAAAAPRDMRFESAKMATAQRAMSSVAMADSLSAAVNRDATRSTRRVDARTFNLRDSVWTDQRYRSGMAITAVKPFSKAYFDLI